MFTKILTSASSPKVNGNISIFCNLSAPSESNLSWMQGQPSVQKKFHVFSCFRATSPSVTGLEGSGEGEVCQGCRSSTFNFVLKNSYVHSLGSRAYNQILIFKLELTINSSAEEEEKDQNCTKIWTLIILTTNFILKIKKTQNNTFLKCNYSWPYRLLMNLNIMCQLKTHCDISIAKGKSDIKSFQIGSVATRHLGLLKILTDPL